ncbi:unnamed protein product [Leptosia nina]|uniref:Uncharacterized protein n=1 Tax=Leptosia nina TaxID=320188 RepID=A0AAV1J6D9_9NEOP
MASYTMIIVLLLSSIVFQCEGNPGVTRDLEDVEVLAHPIQRRKYSEVHEPKSLPAVESNEDHSKESKLKILLKGPYDRFKNVSFNLHETKEKTIAHAVRKEQNVTKSLYKPIMIKITTNGDNNNTHPPVQTLITDENNNSSPYKSEGNSSRYVDGISNEGGFKKAFMNFINKEANEQSAVTGASNEMPMPLELNIFKGDECPTGCTKIGDKCVRIDHNK